ncbi:sulfur carrier protein ThiS [Ensifer sp. 4252]|uniref:sulfur carrier protein ThiS n=1 Tax=Ensifer sp. 4252 TaxID=3373915 RepID=UPI003D1D6DE3
MNLNVNGDEHEIACSTLAELMAALEYEGSWLATAVNGDLVHAADRDGWRLREHDRIEILSPMKGG